MSDDISGAKALVRVNMQHVAHQVLEIFGVEALGLTLRMLLPKEVRSIGSDEFVKGIIFFSHVKGRVSRVEDEENHTEGEHINNLALIWLVSKDLGGHVACGTKIGPVDAGAIASLKRTSKTEIDNFD